MSIRKSKILSYVIMLESITDTARHSVLDVPCVTDTARHSALDVPCVTDTARHSVLHAPLCSLKTGTLDGWLVAGL